MGTPNHQVLQEGPESFDREWIIMCERRGPGWHQRAHLWVGAISGSMQQQKAAFCEDDDGKLNLRLRERASESLRGKETNSKPQTSWTGKGVLILYTCPQNPAQRARSMSWCLTNYLKSHRGQRGASDRNKGEQAWPWPVTADFSPRPQVTERRKVWKQNRTCLISSITMFLF